MTAKAARLPGHNSTGTQRTRKAAATKAKAGKVPFGLTQDKPIPPHHR